MLAVCKISEGVGGIAVEEREPRDPEAKEILVKVAAAGICGTDIQIYQWAPRMARRMRLPRILGHEVCGYVVKVGKGVSNVIVGDYISLESHVYCGTCRQCRMGNEHLCINTVYPGIDFDGCFAEFITVPSQIAWKNPKDMPIEVAAMMEPFGISVHATLAGSGVAGRTVMINGCGPIGLMNVAAARALGATRIVSCDINPIRLKNSKKMGADIAVNPLEQNLQAILSDITNAAGVDVAIEYSGSEQGFNACFEALSKGGDLRLVGAPPKAIPVDFTQWLLKCPEMQNIHGRRIWGSWQVAAELLSSGAVDLSPIHSHSLSIAEGLQGFDLILNGKALKPLIIP